MKNKYVKAKIKWVAPEENGKKIIEVGIRYNPIIFFDNINFGDTLWSADIYIDDLDQIYESNIRLSFLADEAPFHVLQPNTCFSLYEGAKLVAKGTIIEP